MSFLLADAAKLSRNQLQRGVIEQIITESQILQWLPFQEITGSAAAWNTEATTGGAAYYDPLGTWAEGAMTLDAQTTLPLTIIGGDADIDNFIQNTYADPNDITAEVIRLKAKAVAYQFNDGFFHGSGAGTPLQAKGLDAWAGAVQTAYTSLTRLLRAWSNGANGATLTLDMLDKTIDAVKPGRPDMLFMSKRSRRKLSSLRRASGNILETHVNEFGRHVVYYDGIPITTDDNITDTETQGASGAVASSIYAVKFGSMDGVGGIQHGSIQVIPIGDLETKDAKRYRIRWYCNVTVKGLLSMCRLAGVLE